MDSQRGLLRAGFHAIVTKPLVAGALVAATVEALASDARKARPQATG